MVTVDHIHWGIAAYVFSLDLGKSLVPFIALNWPWDSIRSAARISILKNREMAEAHGAPVMLRDTMVKVMKNDNHGKEVKDGIDPFVEWVDTKLITAGRPRNAKNALLAPLYDISLLNRIDTEFGYPLDEAESYAAMLHSAIDAEVAEKLFDAVFEVDDQIDRKILSDWDQALIKRNAKIHSVETPLAPLIHSLTNELMVSAAKRVLHMIGSDRSNRLESLCLSNLS